MTGDFHIAQEDLAFYAMQNLPAEEAAAIRAHLAVCEPCRSELTKVQGALSLIALGVDLQNPPLGARQRFLDKMRGEPMTPALQSKPPITEPQAVSSPRRRGVSRWVPWVFVAAAVIVAIALGVQNRALNEQLKDESILLTNLAAKASHAQQVWEILTSPAAQRVTLVPGKMPNQPMGHATYLMERGGLIFQASNLKPLPQGMTYELWMMPANGHPPMPAGLFQPDSSGRASIVMPPIPEGIAAKGFGVTMEKRGGSSTPTMPILLSGTVAGE